ncbi:MAG: molybdopterin-synthase adenylyltransferase MoeB [Thermodesulfovibrionales bacterium]|nr:molybdopterin-synthase adenylyltransferase MoeB [Thermodesulfovibrionales bacterium]
MRLSEDQLRRYHRHIILPEVGEEGQHKLLQAKVLVVGAGGLASAAGYYLAAAGVGTIALVDDDTVDLSNLQRQIVHSTETIGQPKVLSAKKTLETLNPDVTVVPLQQRLSGQNIHELIKSYDIIVDCSDNFPTRFLVNDSCVAVRKPLVTGAVVKFEGQVLVVVPGEGPCYRCLFEAPPPHDAFPAHEDGVLGALPGVIGSLQATEVFKLILSVGETLKGHLLIYDALKVLFRKVRVPINPHCTTCGQ